MIKSADSIPLLFITKQTFPYLTLTGCCVVDGKDQTIDHTCLLYIARHSYLNDAASQILVHIGGSRGVSVFWGFDRNPL